MRGGTPPSLTANPRSEGTARSACGCDGSSSLSSRDEVHPGSAGKSVLPSPSLSRPSTQRGTSASLTSLAEAHPGSAGKSAFPSPSLSTPSPHAGGPLSVVSRYELQLGSSG